METTLNELIKKQVKHSKVLFLLICVEIIIIFILNISNIKIESCFIIFPLLFLTFNFLGEVGAVLKCYGLKNNTSIKNDLKDKIVYYPEGCLLTNNYLVIEFSQKRIINYKDIVLIYMKNSYSKTGLKKYLWIVLRNEKKYSVFINKNDFFDEYNFEFEDVLNVFTTKNKEILVGNTKENKKILLEKYNIKI